jgi:hypothetical protein
MLMVIFGAGASYDSDERRPAEQSPEAHGRPPLTEHLLDERHRVTANRYPASLSVIDYVQQNLATDTPSSLETVLAQYAARCENSFPCRQALVAFRFYLCQVITEITGDWLTETRGLTVYLTLLNQLLEWQETSKERVQLVTFNYDTLLEDAATRVLPEWTISQFGDYVTREDWGLLKLHGSIDWSRVGREDSGQANANTLRAIAAANQAYAELPFAFVNATGIAGSAGGPEVYFRAMAVPMANKTTFECEDLQVQAFKSTIGDIRRLLICGWRAAEAHALAILSDINPGFYLGIVTGGTNALAEVQGNLGDVYRKGKLVMTQEDGMSAFATGMRQQLEPLLAPW